MESYVIYPDIAGELLTPSNGEIYSHKISDWRGDDLIKSGDYLVTHLLAEALRDGGYSGFCMKPANVLNATKYITPAWEYLQISEMEPQVDITIDHERRLVVSGRLHSLLKEYNLDNAEIMTLDSAPTLAERNRDILNRMMKLGGKPID